MLRIRSTATYTYNHTNTRTKLVEGSDTTVYPTDGYEVKNGTPKLYLSLGDLTIATTEGTTTSHLLSDHLGGTTLTTSSTGVVTSLLDYYPYGATRLDTGSNSETTQLLISEKNIYLH